MGWSFRYLFPEARHQGKTVVEWVAALDSRDVHERAAAVQALQALGPEAVPVLTRELKSIESRFPRVRRWLSRVSPEPVKRAVRKWRGARGQETQAAALQALRVMGTNGAAAIPAVAATFGGPDVYLASLAGRALAAAGPEGLPVLIAGLDDPDYSIRSHACTALGSLGTNAAPAVPKLANLLTNEAGSIVRLAGFTLSQIGKPAVPALLPIALSTNVQAARWASYALGLIGPDARAAVPELLGMLPERPQPVWRETALFALGRMGLPDSTAAELVARSLGDADPTIRAAAIQALAERPRYVRERVERVVELLDDPDAKVREQAALALSRIGRAGAPALAKLEALRGGSSNAVTRAAAEALANIQSSLQTAPLAVPPR